MKIITILGDSISMIRPDNGITQKELYSYKMQEKLGSEFYIVNKAIRGSYARIINDSLFETILHSDSEIVILFFGIVDCFPRLFDLKEQQRINIIKKMHLEFLIRPIIKYRSKNRYKITKRKQKVYTEINEFEELYGKIVNSILEIKSVKKIILVNIPAENELGRTRNYGLAENIIEYNKIIEKIGKNNNLQIVDFYKITKEKPELVLDDGMHINKYGHDYLAHLLQKEIILKKD